MTTVSETVCRPYAVGVIGDVVEPGDIARTQWMLDDLDTCLADAASDLRASGVNWQQLAGALGVAGNSAKERYGCRPRPFEVERFARRVASHDGPTRPRVTVFERFVVADLAACGWIKVRHCATPAEAVALAVYLSEQGAARYVKRPKDAPSIVSLRSWSPGPDA